MAIKQITVLPKTGGPPEIGTLDIDSAFADGVGRYVLVLLQVSDSNPTAHSFIIDRDGSGTDDYTADTAQALTAGTDLLLDGYHTACYYILDADLPAASGTYNIQIAYTLVDDGLLATAYYLEGAIQAAPEFTQIFEHINVSDILAPTLDPLPISDADVFDIVKSTENVPSEVYFPDQPQVSAYSNAGNFSSYVSQGGEQTMGWTRISTSLNSHLQMVVSVQSPVLETTQIGNIKLNMETKSRQGLVI